MNKNFHAITIRSAQQKLPLIDAKNLGTVRFKKKKRTILFLFLFFPPPFPLSFYTHRTTPTFRRRPVRFLSAKGNLR